MPRINERGYLERVTSGNGTGTTVYRNWWFVRQSSEKTCSVNLNNVKIPIKYLGKRVRFKMELVDDKESGAEEELDERPKN